MTVLRNVFVSRGTLIGLLTFIVFGSTSLYVTCFALDNSSKTANSSQSKKVNQNSSAYKELNTKERALFDEAYALYRKDDFKAARRKLESISNAKKKAEPSALLIRMQFSETFVQNLQKSDSSDLSKLATSLSKLVNELHVLHSQLRASAQNNPRSAAIQELLGENANAFSTLFKSLYIPVLTNVGQDLGSATNEHKRLQKEVIQAFERCIQLEPNRSFSHVKLAAHISIETDGLNDPRIADHLLQAIESDPNSKDGIDLFVQVMWQTPLLSDPKQVFRIQHALDKLNGDALAELKKSQQQLEITRRKLGRALERIAATGFENPELLADYRKLSKAISIVETALDR